MEEIPELKVKDKLSESYPGEFDLKPLCELLKGNVIPAKKVNLCREKRIKTIMKVRNEVQ